MDVPHAVTPATTAYSLCFLSKELILQEGHFAMKRLDPGTSLCAALLAGLVLCVLMAEALGGEVCYEPLGCFTDDKPYSGTPQRPKAALPWTPKKIGARFLLFTPENPTKHQVIREDSIASIESSNFKTTRKTCIIIHGMADKAEDSWVSKMCNEIVTMDDVNCIGVDWRRGSGNIAIYVQAANNARLVGAVVAHFLKIIQENINSSYSGSSIHLIGHSLGAHAAGETGKRYSGIWKITGLDPAHPYFEDTPAEVRLDTSDAFFVEVMHTDTGSPLGVGIKNPIGHRDIYPNGGKQMPGCPNKISAISNFNALVDILACNHLRAIHYYTASIRHPGGFLAYPCDSYKAFKEGSCFPCPAPGCPLMGYFSNSSHSVTSPQSYYLHTSTKLNEHPSWRYKLSVTLRGKSGIQGALQAVVHSEEGIVEECDALTPTKTPAFCCCYSICTALLSRLRSTVSSHDASVTGGFLDRTTSPIQYRADAPRVLQMFNHNVWPGYSSPIVCLLCASRVSISYTLRFFEALL